MNVMIFSGARFAATGGGQMPTQLARQFVAMGHNVYFNQYHLTRQDEAMAYGIGTRHHMPELRVLPVTDWTRYADDFWSSEDSSLHLASELFGLLIRMVPGVAIVMMPSPFFTSCARKLRELGWRVVYYALDDWKGFAKVGDAPWWKEDAESNCWKTTGLALATAKSLASKLPHVHGVIGNGYDPDRFHMADPFQQVGERRRVGYWGHLAGEWFDWDLLFSLSDAFPTLDFDLVGPDPRNTGTLLSAEIWRRSLFRSNVIFHGEIPNDELCRFADDRGWEAGLLPFKQGSILEAVSPIKGFEYLASGLPFICPPMPETEGWPRTFQARDLTAWLEALAHREDIHRGHPDREVLAWLQDKTWQARAKAVMEACGAA